MRMTSKGQVTIPKNIRTKLGIQPGSEVEFVEEGRKVFIRKRRGAEKNPFSELRGIATVKMTTDEILALTRSE